ncbi:hypothetical protein JOQ06_025798 [Pogonophryne albipinna]|uniref:Uncharacterized protein n=1 Tax=Pogonophryne albipinna TaxID=1090488 RepID=A0AAD6AWF6_9TELE|nr:hypothetical protein JOQ06_025798 [Pogonophryne albipinna]
MMKAWRSLSLKDGATQMICLAMAVINHRQPEGTASTHGKESGVAQRSTHSAMCGHGSTYFVPVLTL